MFALNKYFIIIIHYYYSVPVHSPVSLRVCLHDSLFACQCVRDVSLPDCYFAERDAATSLLWNQLTPEFLSLNRSKTHKELRERFLIWRNGTKRANFRRSPLFQATYKHKKWRTNSIYLVWKCPLNRALQVLLPSKWIVHVWLSNWVLRVLFLTWTLQVLLLSHRALYVLCLNLAS